MSGKRRKPDWTPQNAGEAFAGSVVPGKSESAKPNPRPDKTLPIAVANLAEGVRAGNRTALGKAITLVESNAPKHQRQAQEMLLALLPHSGNSIRIGITGVPGAGKSTLIERLGLMLADQGHRIAVLTVDPSSSLTRGSILGDKTRMSDLARHANSFIRPSPSGGVLGGVAKKTRETIQVCEASGYGVILVETIGVGQSEITVRGMVDYFMMVQITGAGDDLQGIKKGVMELVDAIAVNKVDGPNRQQVLATRQELESALHFFPPASEGWQTPVRAVSAVSGEGIEQLWQDIRSFQTITRENGVFEKRRQSQNLNWLHDLIRESLLNRFYQQPGMTAKISQIEAQINRGNLTAAAAASLLLQHYLEGQ